MIRGKLNLEAPPRVFLFFSKISSILRTRSKSDLKTLLDSTMSLLTCLLMFLCLFVTYISLALSSYRLSDQQLIKSASPCWLSLSSFLPCYGSSSALISSSAGAFFCPKFVRKGVSVSSSKVPNAAGCWDLVLRFDQQNISTICLEVSWTISTRFLLRYFPLRIKCEILFFNCLSLELASAKQGIEGQSLPPSSKLMRNSAKLGFWHYIALQSTFPDPFCSSSTKTGALQHFVKGIVSESEKKTQKDPVARFSPTKMLKMNRLIQLNKLAMIWQTRGVRSSSGEREWQL